MGHVRVRPCIGTRLVSADSSRKVGADGRAEGIDCLTSGVARPARGRQQRQSGVTRHPISEAAAPASLVTDPGYMSRKN